MKTKNLEWITVCSNFNNLLNYLDLRRQESQDLEFLKSCIAHCYENLYLRLDVCQQAESGKNESRYVLTENLE